MSINDQPRTHARIDWFNIGFDAYYWRPGDPQPPEVDNAFKLTAWRKGWSCAKRYANAIRDYSK